MWGKDYFPFIKQVIIVQFIESCASGSLDCIVPVGILKTWTADLLVWPTESIPLKLRVSIFNRNFNLSWKIFSKKKGIFDL